MGAGPIRVRDVSFSATERLTLGEALHLELEFTLAQDRPAEALIDLVVQFRKADGSLKPKVFKWTQQSVRPGKIVRLSKRLPLRDVSTRKHYEGTQRVEVQLNGNLVAGQDFWLGVRSSGARSG